MKIHSLFILCFLASPLFAAEIGLELLPRGRPFRLTFADPREIQMKLAFEGDSKLNAVVGNYFSIFGIRPTVDSDWQLHFGLEGGGFFSMRQAQSRFPLETADGLLGMYFEGANGPLQAQLRFTHISAHFADGSTDIPIAYSREFISLRGAYLLQPEWQVYSGIQFLVNTVPKVHPWSLQWGTTYFLPIGFTKISPFVGADFKWKEESKYNPSFHIQLGIALNNPPEAYRSFRFFYSYYTGADPRGQYYDRAYTAHSFGIEMQI